MTVSVVLTGALTLAIWSWWDPSPGTLAVAAGAAVAGPVTEIVLVAIHAQDADGLDGDGAVAAVPLLRGWGGGGPAVGGRRSRRPGE